LDFSVSINHDWLHKTDRTAVYGPVRTVVWEGSGRKARPYPDPARERGRGIESECEA
jgi:hypothetical protein